MVKPGKPKSKRKPVRLRHRIEKASAAKQRKARKLAKSNPEWRSRLKKDPGIPNLFPYKDRILHEIEEKRRLKEEQAIRKHETGAVDVEKTAAVDDDLDEADLDDDLSAADMDDDLANASTSQNGLVDEAMDEDDDNANPMAALLASARARAAEYEEQPESSDDDSMEASAAGGRPEATRRTSTSLFQQVLSSADIILYVLDARDPDGTRSRAIERQIASYDGGSKRLMLILNKIDLVPPAVLKAWLTHLRRYFPTLPLRANTPAANARTFDHKALTAKGTTETLLRALKSYGAAQDLKRAVTVGVVGYPNVGKSSVINALAARLAGAAQRTPRLACPVGAAAGLTTAVREVRVDSRLKLLDSPGIVFPSAAAAAQIESTSVTTEARLTLLNALPPKQISDPIAAVTLLLQRMAAPEAMARLRDVYSLPPLMPDAGGDLTQDFLLQVARKRGRLGKGGVANINSAASGVLSDWRDGRISGWVEAPVLGLDSAQSDDAADDTADHKEIVQQWSREFKLEGLWGDVEDADGVGHEEPVVEMQL